MRTRAPDRGRLRWPRAAAVLAVTAAVIAAGQVAKRVEHPGAVPSTTAQLTAGPTVGASRGGSPAVTAPGGSTDTAPPALAAPGSALAAARKLVVKGLGPSTRYSPARFDPAKANPANYGCGNRGGILRRDLTAITIRAGTGGCEVAVGILSDPYSGATIRYTHGPASSSPVQIDHVVTLADAWRTGAARWVDGARSDFAEDPLDLLAVKAAMKDARRGRDAATWLPPAPAGRCAYVARQVAVKARYRLSVTPAEEHVIIRVLSGCPGQRLPTNPGSAPPPPDPTAAR